MIFSFLQVSGTLYLAVLLSNIYRASFPPPCDKTPNKPCFLPFTPSSTPIYFNLYTNNDCLENPSTFVHSTKLSPTLELSTARHTFQFNVTVPDCLRSRISPKDGLEELSLKVVTHRLSDDYKLSSSTIPLTKLIETKELFWPTFKYIYNPILLRHIDESRPTSGSQFFSFVRDENNNNFYLPTIKSDEIALRELNFVDLARPNTTQPTKPPITVKLRYTSISLLRFIAYDELKKGLEISSNFLGAAELDEIRYLVSDDHIYRFLLQNVIGYVHLFLSFMAFKNDVGFFRKKRDMKGISRSSFVSSFVCNLVIFLYLCDGPGTSSLVIVSVGGGVAVDFWKLCRLLRPKIVGFRIVFADSSRGEKESNNWDQIATTYVSLSLLPLVVGVAVYNYKFFVYSGVWSWFISNAANCVYTLGFVSLCPQLFINYKLKSVAHLPIRMFVYKFFNTFIDDVFACMVEMPMKHRLMTLRDDVVFAGFIYQWFIYRTDLTRPNEYGIAFAAEEEKKPIKIENLEYEKDEN